MQFSIKKINTIIKVNNFYSILQEKEELEKTEL